MKITAIYREDWMSGSHWHCLVKLKRIELQNGETVADALERVGLTDSVQYLFNGWPEIVGEVN